MDAATLEREADVGRRLLASASSPSFSASPDLLSSLSSSFSVRGRTSLPTTIVAGDLGHVGHHNTLHAVANALTPVAGNAEVIQSLVNQGLRLATANPDLNIGTGTLTCGTLSAGSVSFSGTTLASLVVTGGNWRVDAAGRVAQGGAAISLTTMLTSLGGVAHPGTATVLRGVSADALFPSTTTAEGHALEAKVRTAAAAFTMTYGMGLYVNPPTIGASSALTNAYGIYLENQGLAGVTNAFGIYVAPQSGASGVMAAGRFGGGTTTNLWLDSDQQGGGGIAFGSARDVNLYRLNSTTLATDDSFSVAVNAYVGGTSDPSGGGARFTVRASGNEVATFATNTGTGGYMRWYDLTGAAMRGYIGHGAALFTGATINDFGLRSNTGSIFLAANSSTAQFTMSNTLLSMYASLFQVDSVGRMGVGTAITADRMLNVLNTTAHPGSATTLYTVFARATFPSTTTNAAASYWSSVRTAAASFTLQSGLSYWAAAPVLGAGSSVTSMYGVYVENQGVAGVGSAYGIYVLAQGNATSNVGVRIDTATQAALWLGADTTSTGIAGGIAFGSGKDVLLYRSAAAEFTVSAGLVVTLGNHRIDSQGRQAWGGSTVATSYLVNMDAAHPGSGIGLYGVVNQPIFPSTTTSEANGYYSSIRTAAAAFNVANAYSFRIDAPQLGAGSTITEIRGFYSGNLGNASITNAYGLFVSAQSGAVTINVAARFDGGTTANLWLNSNTASLAGGIAFGSTRDAGIWRSNSAEITVHAGLVVDTGNFRLDSSGRVSVATGTSNVSILSMVGNGSTHPGSATSLYGALVDVTYPSTTTSNGFTTYSRLRTAAAAFTMGLGLTFFADSPGIGAGSTVTAMVGFYAANMGASGVTNAEGIRVTSQSGAATLNIGARLQGGSTANLWLDNDTASGAGGIALGTTRDVTIFRSGSAYLTIGAGLVVNAGNHQIDSVGRMAIGSSVNAQAALFMQATHQGSATTLYGFINDWIAPSTTTANFVGSLLRTRTAAAAFTMATNYNVWIETPSLGAGSAITTSYGLYVENQGGTGVGTGFGIRVLNQNSAGTVSYAASLEGGQTANLWLNSDTAGAPGGVAFGTARDLALSRAGASVLLVATKTWVGDDSPFVTGSNISAPGSNAMAVGTQGAASLQLYTNNASRVTVDSAGRVALGTITTTEHFGLHATHPSTATSIFGLVQAMVAPSTATVAFYGNYSLIKTAAASFTVAAAHAFYADAPVLGASSAITTTYGMWVANQGGTGVVNVYGMVIAPQSGASTFACALRLDGGTNANLWLNNDAATAGGGIVFGTNRDFSLHRAAADFLRTSAALGTSRTSAPADASLAAGDLAIWLDSTNGASKAMFKAKQADGTVKTASVALA